MNRTFRIFVGAAVLVLLVAGSVYATRSNPGERRPVLAAASKAPTSPDAEDEAGSEPLTADHAARLLDLLSTAGIDGVTADQLTALAAKYGVGGAVRLEAWATASGKSVAEVGAMVDSGKGWGAIAQELNDANASLNLSPGIGWIMSGGHGHGAGSAAKAKTKQTEPEASDSSS